MFNCNQLYRRCNHVDSNKSLADTLLWAAAWCVRNLITECVCVWDSEIPCRFRDRGVLSQSSVSHAKLLWTNQRSVWGGWDDVSKGDTIVFNSKNQRHFVSSQRSLQHLWCVFSRLRVLTNTHWPHIKQLLAKLQLQFSHSHVSYTAVNQSI